jgi:tetraacyldisaccharide 4'-kinase
LIHSQSVSAPVVIVGNIAVGGTGKTPLTIWLAQQLAARGYKPGIISRGYHGRVGPKPMEVTSDSDPAIVGDEAVLIANRSEYPVVVHPDRVAAANLAIDLGANVIVSDDGLQHYRLARDFEITVVDGTRRHGNRQLLPAGPLREPVSRLQTSNQILVQRESENSADLSYRSSDRPPIEFQLTASAICRPDNSDIRNIEDFAGTKVHALAGIGNPERFFRLLEARDIEVIRHPLPDHAEITPGDLEFDDDLDVVMTEKDAVKCRWLDTRKCWYVPVDVAIDDADAEGLLNRILEKISPGEKDVDTQM